VGVDGRPRVNIPAAERASSGGSDGLTSRAM
jgi:hypothetical protein